MLVIIFTLWISPASVTLGHHIVESPLQCPGHVPHTGDTCQMVGMLPPHSWNMQRLSRACGTCLGQCTSQLHIQDVFCMQNTCNASWTCSMCLGHVPDGGHTAPTSCEH